MVTLLQFLSVILITLASSCAWDRGLPRLPARRVPLALYAVTSALFGLQSILNNYVFQFNVSVPLQTVFRSSSLPASIALGWAMFGKRYSARQCAIALAIAAGVAVITLGDAGKTAAACAGCDAAIKPAVAGAGAGDAGAYSIGIALLVLSLCMSALLGHGQERWLRAHSPTGAESMLYSHLLSLPFFAAVAPEVLDRTRAWLAASAPGVVAPAIAHATLPVTLPAALADVITSVPGLNYLLSCSPAGALSLSPLCLLLLNVCTQFVCVAGVYALSTRTSALTTTMAITVRKFLSVMLSVVYFDAQFSAVQWAAAAVVFVGALAYIDVKPPAKPAAGGQIESVKGDIKADTSLPAAAAVETRSGGAQKIKSTATLRKR